MDAELAVQGNDFFLAGCDSYINQQKLPDGAYVEVNEAWTQLFGYQRVEALGRSSLELGIWVNPAEREMLARMLAAGEPVRNIDFTRALGKALNRPAFIPVPAAPLRWVAGDLARELLLGGQRVLPAAALRSGFSFAYPELTGALKAIFRRV